MLRKLKKTELKNTCKLSELPFNTTDDISSLKKTIGQKRALSALEFGLDIDGHGFNIYILGESGTGKLTTIKNILKEKSKNETPPKDWCYVYNFKDNDNPLALSLPPGKGISFQKNMDEMISVLRQEIPKILDSKEYEKQRASIIENFQSEQKEHFSSLEKEAKKNEFILRKTVSGLVLVPVKKTGETMSEKEYEDLKPELKSKVEAIGKALQEKLDDAIRIVRDEEKKIKEIIKDLERQATHSSVEHRIEDIRTTFRNEADVSKYLDEVKEDILDNLDDFKLQEEHAPAMPFMKPPKSEPSFNKYAINVFVNNRDQKGAPVVVESNPTYFNLFGRVEHKLQYGMAMTDFTMIKAGALQRANGGYLVIDALELLKNIFAYDSLKRTIKDKEIKIEDIWEQYRQVSTVTLRPEALPFNVKIILVGSPQLYYMLYSLDEEYRELFKVKADYESRMDRKEENTLKYASFVQTKCKEKGLKPFDKGAVAKVIE